MAKKKTTARAQKAKKPSEGVGSDDQAGGSGGPHGGGSSSESLAALRAYVQGRIDDVQELHETYFNILDQAMSDDDYEPSEWFRDVLKLHTTGWTALLNGLRLPTMSTGGAARARKL